jgi:hypothetical protein
MPNLLPPPGTKPPRRTAPPRTPNRPLSLTDSPSLSPSWMPNPPRRPPTPRPPPGARNRLAKNRRRQSPKGRLLRRCLFGHPSPRAGPFIRPSDRIRGPLAPCRRRCRCQCRLELQPCRNQPARHLPPLRLPALRLPARHLPAPHPRRCLRPAARQRRRLAPFHRPPAQLRRVPGRFCPARGLRCRHRKPRAPARRQCRVRLRRVRQPARCPRAAIAPWPVNPSRGR